MNTFTPAELATLQGLVNFHVKALAQAARHPATTPEGRLSYQREIEASERLRDKLVAATEVARTGVRPGGGVMNRFSPIAA